jgi:hypothetical protein
MDLNIKKNIKILISKKKDNIIDDINDNIIKSEKLSIIESFINETEKIINKEDEIIIYNINYIIKNIVNNIVNKYYILIILMIILLIYFYLYKLY